MMASIFAKDARLQMSTARDEIKTPVLAKFPQNHTESQNGRGLKAPQWVI